MRSLKLAGIIVLLAVLVNVSKADSLTSVDSCQGQCSEDSIHTQESIIQPESVAWSVYFDNDLFTSNASDQDYTGGLAVSFSGSDATKHPFSVDRALNYFNKVTTLDKLFGNSDFVLHSCEIGLTVFTPNDIQTSEPIVDGRPYSSLIYTANTQQHLVPKKKIALNTTLSVGILGAKIAGEIQNKIHDWVGSDEAKGWDNQISNGGELTFRYGLTLQKYYQIPDSNIEFTTAARASFGYLTEASYGASFRWGKIRSPWWNFNANRSRYGEKSHPNLVPSNKRDELFFFLGGNLNLRLYNAFLQGQFRDSAVTYDYDQTEPLIAEFWLGVTKEFTSGFRASYVLRAQTSELKEGYADRGFMWGSIDLSYIFS